MLRIPKEQWPRLLGLILLGILGVFLLVMGGLPHNRSAGNSVSPPSGSKAVDAPAQGGLATAEAAIEARLKSVLDQVEGAGQVDVRVTLAQGPLYQYAVNTSSSSHQVDETNNDGAHRVTTTEKGEEGQLVMRQAGGVQDPVVVRETGPEVLGVLVLAQGADNALVKARLTAAVETLLGVDPHQIVVLPKQTETN